MILIDVELSTTAAQRDDLIALLDNTMRASRTEPGCLIYRFSADLTDPLTFYLVELWQDEAALTTHFQGEAFSVFAAQIAAVGRVESSKARNGDLQPYEIKRPAR